MRLIDADELKKHKYHSDITHENAVSVAQIDWMPTVCDIDAIKREIEDLYIITNPASDPYDGGYYTALIDVKRIIDKYN